MDQVSFRPLTVDDLPDLVRWRAEPHVLAWFADLLPDLDAACDRYGPRLEGRTPYADWIALWDGRPFGFLQSFVVGDVDDVAVKVQDPRAVAFDYAIGDPAALGRGLGVPLVRGFCSHVLAPRHPEAPRFVALADARNYRSLAVLGRCGFTQGLWVQLPTSDFAEIVCSAPRSLFDRDVEDDAGSGVSVVL